VAVIGAGQSALEAAALLHEAGAQPRLLVRGSAVLWNTRASRKRSILQRLRTPYSGLAGGRKAWLLTHFPGMTHHLPAALRDRFFKDYLPPEGAWWLRERVENVIPIHLETNIAQANEVNGRTKVRLQTTSDRTERNMTVDHVIAGSGYDINVERLTFLSPELRSAIECHSGGPKLNSTFLASIPGLYFIGPLSHISFGPLFRFVVGAEYTARTVSAHLASQASRIA
jgi:thioredoxin reductase